MHVVFERIGSARSFSYHDLFVGRFVAQRFRVKCALADGCQVLFFGTLEIFAVGPSLWFASGSIVVGLEHAMHERDDLSLNLPGSTTVVELWKQAEEATSVAGFCLAVALEPALPRASRNGGALLSRLSLLLILVVVWVNDPIAEQGGSEIDVTGVFQQGATF